MSWMCSGKTNAELVTNLSSRIIPVGSRVGPAMLKVDRANYVADNSWSAARKAKAKAEAYMDAPMGIGHDATISAPHMHAYAAEYLLPYLNPGARVLDVGSGSGYFVAVLHHLVASEDKANKVIGIEHIPELVQFSVENLQKDGLGEALEEKQIEMIAGDGRQGYASAGPYDAIHVGAAAPTLPQPLVDQLKSPGCMFIPVGTHSQQILLVKKDRNGNVTETGLMGVRYVPLTDRKIF